MKLAVIAAAFPPATSGEADHALHLCEHLAARGHDVHVLTTVRELSSSNAQFTVHPIMTTWNWTELPGFVGFLKRCVPDAVLLIYTPRDYCYSPMITFAPSIAKVFLSGLRFVTQFETGLFGPLGSRSGRITRKAVSMCLGAKNMDNVFGTLLSKSDRIIALSEIHLAMFARHCPYLDGRGMVIPPPPLLRISSEDNGATRQRGRKALGVKTDDFLLAYYGYLYKEKGIDTLVKAFAICAGKHDNARLVFIGGNTDEDDYNSSYVEIVKRTVTQLGIANKIIWTGQYSSDSDEASIYLRASDACVFPFDYGVTLNRSSVAAAAAHAVPIVTTKGAHLESAFIDRENVLLCQPGDPMSLATAIGSLIDASSLRQRLSIAALRLANDWFSWDKAVERTLEALRT